MFTLFTAHSTPGTARRVTPPPWIFRVVGMSPGAGRTLMWQRCDATHRRRGSGVRRVA